MSHSQSILFEFETEIKHRQQPWKNDREKHKTTDEPINVTGAGSS
ncbi:MAG: hypothetical protein R2847_12890 [Bacteroidia bacterium]